MAGDVERMVRIIAGSARGLRIKTVPSEGTKPTLDRVKEPMFSILTGEIEGRLVLDLFSGNGSLGLEALSRGAAYAYMNDYDRHCCSVIKENLVYTRLQSQAEVTQLDYREALNRHGKAGRKFGLVLLDPPYGDGLIPDVLTRISQLQLWESGCVAMCEHVRTDVLPETVGVFVKEKERAYGTVGLTLYRAGE